LRLKKDGDDMYLKFPVMTPVGMVQHLRIAYIDTAEFYQQPFCRAALQHLAELLGFEKSVQSKLVDKLTMLADFSFLLSAPYLMAYSTNKLQKIRE
jgi:hypothetical protein